MNENQKQNFLDTLTNMTREEITQFIINNGKEAKGAKPYIYYGKNNKESRRTIK